MTFKTFFLIFFLTANFLSAKELSVVCSSSDLAWLAKMIGREHVKVTALSDGDDDLHFLEATPKFVRLVSNADLLCFVGLELEIGWLPKVIQKSGNLKIKPGQIGSCDCSTYIQALEKPIGAVDRSKGDLHVGGNPHYQLDPREMLNAGKAILESLIKIDSSNKETYTKNFEALTGQMQKLIKELKEKMQKRGSFKVTQYHKEFSYLISFLGLEGFDSIEAIPGVSPSANRLYTFAIECQKNKVELCLATVYSSKNKLMRFNDVSKIPFLQERISLKEYEADLAYEIFMHRIVDKICLTKDGSK